LTSLNYLPSPDNVLTGMTLDVDGAELFFVFCDCLAVFLVFIFKIAPGLGAVVNIEIKDSIVYRYADGSYMAKEGVSVARHLY